MVMPAKSRPDNNAWAPPIWTVVIRVWSIVIWIGIVTRTLACDRRRRSLFLIHIEVDALRDLIGMSPAASGTISANLGELVGGQRKGLDDVFERTEIVEGSVTVAKDFDVGGRVADVFAVGFNSCAGRRGFDQDVVGNSSVGTTFNARRNSLTTGEQSGRSRKAGKNEVICFHISQVTIFFSRCPVWGIRFIRRFLCIKTSTIKLGNPLRLPKLRWAKWGNFQMEVGRYSPPKTRVIKGLRRENALRCFTGGGFAAKMNENEIWLEIVRVPSVCADTCARGSGRRQRLECGGGGESEQQQFNGTGELLLRKTTGTAAKRAANDVDGRKHQLDEDRF
jgi:hypothetical protein